PPFLQFGDDLVGNVVVKIAASAALAGAVLSGHRDNLRDGRRRPLLQSSTRHGQLLPSSFSTGADIARRAGPVAGASVSKTSAWVSSRQYAELRAAALEAGLCDFGRDRNAGIKRVITTRAK